MSPPNAKEVTNVYQRMSEACRIIGSQEWVLNMENRQYKSIPIDDMRAGVRKACVQAGLVHVGPLEVDCTREVVDGRTFRYYGSCKFRYINVDDPSQMIEYDSMGEAMDNGDKGTAKFITNLIKNHYKAAFDIGELGKDDIDSYSNEELYEEAAKIEAKTNYAKERVFEDKANFAKANACKKAITEWIDADPMTNASHEIIANYAERFGRITEWKAGTYIQCYKELKDAKVPNLPEVA